MRIHLGQFGSEWKLSKETWSLKETKNLKQGSGAAGGACDAQMDSDGPEWTSFCHLIQAQALPTLGTRATAMRSPVSEPGLESQCFTQFHGTKNGSGWGMDKPQVATNLPTPQMFLYSSSRCRKKEIPSLSFFFSSDHLSRRPSTAGIIGSADSLDVDRSPVPQMMTKQHQEEKNERILSKAVNRTGIHIQKQEFVQHPQGLVAVPIWQPMSGSFACVNLLMQADLWSKCHCWKPDLILRRIASFCPEKVAKTTIKTRMVRIAALLEKVLKFVMTSTNLLHNHLWKSKEFRSASEVQSMSLIITVWAIQILTNPWHLSL